MANKGDMEWSTLGMWIFILMLTLVVVIIIYIFRDKIMDMIQGIGDLFTFGGA